MIGRSAFVGELAYLRRVVKEYDFTFKSGKGTDGTDVHFNEMILYEPTWRELHRPNNLLPAEKSVDTLYHEFTHAYIDIVDFDETHTWDHLLRVYASAKLVNGKSVGDAERVAQEAAAMYVGHRAGSVWKAWDRMHFLNSILDAFEAKKITADQMRDYIHQDVLRWGTIPEAYNQAMLRRVFGYEEVDEKHIEIADEPIPPQLRTWCDAFILEAKIRDDFHHMNLLYSRYQRLLERLNRHYRGWWFTRGGTGQASGRHYRGGTGQASGRH